MPKKLKIEQVIEKLKIKDSNLTLVKETYTNMRTKAKFIDKEHGEWWTAPRNILSYNQGHPKRVNKIYGLRLKVILEMTL